MPILRCPADDELSAFLSGSLAEAALDSVSAHVDHCNVCLERLSRLEASSLLEGTTAPDAALQDAAYLIAVDRLLQGDAPAATILPGSRLRDYRLLEVLGEGGMGIVHKARHEKLDKLVAVKVMRPGPWSHSTALARFEREMKAVGRLKHEAIVQATDAGEADGVPFLVMELVDGVNLSRLVKDRGPLHVKEALSIIRQAAQGLQHAHEAGLIHRDIKPGNLMLTPGGQVKILDLGLAVIREVPEISENGAATVELAGDLTSPSRMVGTRDYMAPEQTKNAHAVDARADVYGLGGTLWYLLTGKPPDEGPPPNALPQKIWNRLLATKPEDRFGSMRELLEAFEGKTRTGWIIAASFMLAASAFAAWVIWPKPTSSEVASENPAPAAGKLPMTPGEAKELQAAWADQLQRPVLDTAPNGIRFALIPPGHVPISATAVVAITKPFEIAICETTVAEFEAFVNATGYMTDAETNGLGGRYLDHTAPRGQKFKVGPQFHWRNPGYKLIDKQQPVTQVSWNDACKYCEWLTKTTGRMHRLPTEAEWLWAARAGEATDPGERILRMTSTAADNPSWVEATVGRPLIPKPVGTRSANVWGLHDLFGNVCEICLDEFADPPVESQPDYCCRESNHGYHVIRGEMFYSMTVGLDKNRGHVEHCHECIGFRIVREIAK